MHIITHAFAIVCWLEESQVLPTGKGRDLHNVRVPESTLASVHPAPNVLKHFLYYLSQTFPPCKNSELELSLWFVNLYALICALMNIPI